MTQTKPGGELGMRIERIRARIEEQQERDGVPEPKRLTRPRLAKLCKVHYTAAIHWAAGRCGPRNLHNVARALEKFGVSMDEVFGTGGGK